VRSILIIAVLLAAAAALAALRVTQADAWPAWLKRVVEIAAGAAVVGGLAEWILGGGREHRRDDDREGSAGGRPALPDRADVEEREPTRESAEAVQEARSRIDDGPDGTVEGDLEDLAGQLHDELEDP